MTTTTYNVILGIAVLVAVVFIAVIYITGKGDAMSSGGGSIRTSFKGKASIEDQIAKVTYIIAAIFMVLMLALDIVGSKVFAA